MGDSAEPPQGDRTRWAASGDCSRLAVCSGSAGQGHLGCQVGRCRMFQVRLLLMASGEWCLPGYLGLNHGQPPSRPALGTGGPCLLKMHIMGEPLRPQAFHCIAKACSVLCGGSTHEHPLPGPRQPPCSPGPRALKQRRPLCGNMEPGGL